MADQLSRIALAMFHRAGGEHWSAQDESTRLHWRQLADACLSVLPPLPVLEGLLSGELAAVSRGNNDDPVWKAAVLQTERSKIGEAYLTFFSAVRKRDEDAAEWAFAKLAGAIMSSEPSKEDMAWAIECASRIVAERPVVLAAAKPPGDDR